jgi:hypothetical protein
MRAHVQACVRDDQTDVVAVGSWSGGGDGTRASCWGCCKHTQKSAPGVRALTKARALLVGFVHLESVVQT